MTEFNLRQVVRDVLRESDEADPGVIAGQVIARIPKSAYGAALSQAMRLFVRQVVSETRTSNAPPSNVRPIRPTPSKSWKGQGIRDNWQRRLKDRVHVGRSEWKLLGQCTYADLMAAASERQELADRNRAWARQYRAYASAVEEAEVETFADLPAEVQMHLLGGAA